MPHVFTFSSGYQFWVKEDYNPLLADLAISAWRADHPQPEPTTKYKTVPVKGGTESIPYKDWSDPTYIALYSVWLSDLQTFQEVTTIKLACDTSKLDPEVLSAARKFAEGAGLHFFSEDALLFVRVVANRNVPKGKNQSEYDEFITWVKSIEGPSEALIQMFLRKRIQDRGTAQGENDGSLAVSDVREPQSSEAQASKGPAVKSIDLQGSSRS
jgi:hypothetical protein